MRLVRARSICFGADQPHLFKSSPEYFQPGNKKAIRTLTIFFDPNGSLASLFELPEMKAFKDFIHQHAQGFKLPDEYVDKVSRSMLDIQKTSGPDQMIHFLQMLRIYRVYQPNPNRYLHLVSRMA